MKRVFAVFPRLSFVSSSTRFEYKPAKGWRLLQRLCFWLLAKIGAFACETIQTESITLDDKRLSMQLIEKHIREVNRLMHEPTRLVMGAEDWSELMGDPVLTGALRFSAPVDLREGPTRIFGIDVTILPWMRGLVVLPKETEK